MFDLAELAQADKALTALAYGSPTEPFNAMSRNDAQARHETSSDAPKCPYHRERAA